ncbi:MAG: hypothetical protein O2816_00535 [Planctomycetota bacterium]|nr:hypothetical protein [Planctomycetota bacterium]
MNHLLSRGILCLVLTAVASAQSFNLDVGGAGAFNGNGPPSSGYGAASGQVGAWHWIDADPLQGQNSYTTPPLSDINGAVTGVTADFVCLNPGDSFTLLDADEPVASGDHALLMEDIMYCIGEPYTITFNDLLPGEYEVYTYAMAPDSASLFSLVDVPAGIGGAQVVGGAFPGGHAQGVTFALHTVTVDASGLLVIDISSNASDDSLNGVQLVMSGVGGNPIGTNFCGPANLNSSGAPAVIAAFGSEEVIHNFVRLDAVQMPANEFGYFINSTTQGFVIPPGSQGNLCLGGQIGRHTANVLSTGATGEFSLQLDLTDVPTPGGHVAINPGETWYWQAWFRDNNPGPTNNFTEGICITFL